MHSINSNDNDYRFNQLFEDNKSVIDDYYTKSEIIDVNALSESNGTNQNSSKKQISQAPFLLDDIISSIKSDRIFIGSSTKNTNSNTIKKSTGKSTIKNDLLFSETSKIHKKQKKLKTNTRNHFREINLKNNDSYVSYSDNKAPGTSSGSICSYHNNYMKSPTFDTHTIDLTENSSDYECSKFVSKETDQILHNISEMQSIASTTNIKTETRDNNVVMSIIEGVGVSSEIGFAVLNLQTLECYFSQFADYGSFSKTLYSIGLYSVNKVLMASTTLESKRSKLYNRIKLHFTDMDFDTIPRKFFSEEKGVHAIRRWIGSDDQMITMMLTQSKYFCLSALGALYEYLEKSSKINVEVSKITARFKSHNQIMEIDPLSCCELELVESKSNSKTNKTLYSSINHTKTKMGSRLLRLNILQPSTDLQTINSRLDAVEELISNECTFFGLQEELKKIPDIDFIINNMIQITDTLTVKQAEKNINTIIDVFQMLCCCKNVAGIISELKSQTNKAVCGLLKSDIISEMIGLIGSKIRDDFTAPTSALALRNLRCHIVKEGQSGFLDVESTQDALDLVKGYCDKYNIAIQIQYKHPHGYHLAAEKSVVDNIGIAQEFLNVKNHKKMYFFTTLDLVKLNDRIKNSITEINILSDKTIAGVISEVCKNVEVFYQLSEAIGLLDMLLSFATLCTTGQYVRPQFTDCMEVVDGRNPILETTCQSVVSNSFSSSEEKHTYLVIGTNTSGKSAFVRQIALTNIMAQMGCFVPAKKACFSIRESLFAQLNHNDSIEMNASSFMVEMRSTAFILKLATKNSLVIIDELGRGTNALDAEAICYSILLNLFEKQAYVFFTTHLISLCRKLITQKEFNVICMGSEVSRINAARNLNIPDSIIDKAKLVSSMIELVDHDTLSEHFKLIE
ncbi:hypothetical protein BB561_003352 [Smittium simulii]|uniref:DNA mismatch repair proteins mutS family domain-containing protein n=1 Tax=Smittium simulii TaxID=133385 RepID=A0A2T9YLV2_9FUNG|nr:hypothetical protein BB561_003352 [Smittium simulii]